MNYIYEFVKKCYPLALAAGTKYNINPLVILAQLSVESDWGRSFSARIRKNYAGIIATKKTNPYWSGKSSPSTTNPKLVFRIYDTPQDSFMDFARLISAKYNAAANSSYNIEEYARQISLSPYISESNGDNRDAYRRGIISRFNQILTNGKDIIEKKKQ